MLGSILCMELKNCYLSNVNIKTQASTWQIHHPCTKSDTQTHTYTQLINCSSFQHPFISGLWKFILFSYTFTYFLICVVIALTCLIFLSYCQNYSIFFPSSCISLIWHMLSGCSIWLPKLHYVNNDHFQICDSSLFIAPKISLLLSYTLLQQFWNSYNFSNILYTVTSMPLGIPSFWNILKVPLPLLFFWFNMNIIHLSLNITSSGV